MADARLARHGINVLEAVMGNRGSTIDDHRDLSDARGNHREEGRVGEACLRCGTVPRRSVVAGRTTVHCPTCQR